MTLNKRLPHYVHLLRLDKPIGIFLLLWPTLWALWLAVQGQPDNSTIFIFVVGVVLTRSAGCVVNDIVDRKFDRQVVRTQQRPLASGQITLKEALTILLILASLALLLVSQLNALTFFLAFIAATLAVVYPFLKRVTFLPQLGLGLAFNFGVPMAFAAETNTISWTAWLVFATAVLWSLIYDTEYAMADMKDDMRIGVKSSAILFGDKVRPALLALQLLFVFMLIGMGYVFHLNVIYYACIALVPLLFLYQQWLIKKRDASECIQAFLNNNWVGLFIFSGIAASYLQ